LNTKRPTIVFFLGPTKPIPSYCMIRQARTGDTVLVRSREMTGNPKTADVAGGKEVKKSKYICPVGIQRILTSYARTYQQEFVLTIVKKIAPKLGRSVI
jgi:hypothetical protein